MILLEGPDGSGKTSLMSTLLDRFPGIEEHERASTSKGGPVDNIFDWAWNDLITWDQQPLSFYDRHPLFSEPIYGPTVRNSLDSRFEDYHGEDMALKTINESLIILCLPDIDTVRNNVYSNLDDQMSGVVLHINSIYEQYRKLKDALYRRRNVFWYDYNRPGDLENLTKVVEAYQIMWNKNRGIHGA